MSKHYKFNLAFFSPTFVLGVIAVTLVTINEASAIPITVDMSDHGGGTFDQEFFKPKGVVFTGGDFVGWVQGDDALIFDQSGITGLFSPPRVTSISVNIAPWLQGTWSYRLAALDVLSNIIDSKTIVVTQDMYDPDHSDFGYFSIDLTGLSDVAGFLVDSTFIRTSSGATLGNNIAALGSMSFTTVPEPAMYTLLGIGLIGFRLMRRDKIIKLN